MTINPLSNSIGRLLPVEIASNLPAPQATENAGSFADIFTEAFDNAVTTDAADKGSAIELLAGEADDMSGLLLDAQKAEIALNLALQIRNKAIDAYDTIMRMSI